ncbi:hypothetical protein B0H15DRAFT_804440 [Mycena belliarum]|uniref:Uncharacterized protein n=1 Tax=Mycena belliarum TaxID=1033014 RepID=A0AAD6TTR3_9AGAR|nr:hypothetical protein B0H15DRAFT_804440 [Mycena belliae]
MKPIALALPLLLNIVVVVAHPHLAHNLLQRNSDSNASDGPKHAPRAPGTLKPENVKAGEEIASGIFSKIGGLLGGLFGHTTQGNEDGEEVGKGVGKALGVLVSNAANTVTPNGEAHLDLYDPRTPADVGKTVGSDDGDAIIDGLLPGLGLGKPVGELVGGAVGAAAS